MTKTDIIYCLQKLQHSIYLTAECNGFSKKKTAYIKIKLLQIQNKALETEYLIKGETFNSLISQIN